ncbi:hypothetical protein K490DRAFT_76209 [Saccharata proteae CBS 121410]|uniref:Nucleoporin Nup54 alpha-helical domain-containing protein n=1 Tax=Saccharata proteae CBS 121410 TaxID=1314787 RepID=A0A9P4LUA3_9PEZI|nr:hypothetical protein K490DRAFT_76209 [Saccharata proteae CBS 121410]
MALGSSLSINTGGSLFGNNTNTSQPAGGSLFGASTNTSQPTSQPAQNADTTGSSLFGGSLAKPAQTGSLFGNTSTQPQQTGSLFGGTLGQNQSQPQQPQSQQSGGLFGNTGQQNQSSTPSLFGGSTTQNQTQNKPSLFSSTPASQPQQSNSLFGNTMSNNAQKPPASNLFGNVTQGNNNQSQNQGQKQLGAQVPKDQVRGITRFGDLYESHAKEIEAVDDFIQQQISAHDQCQAFLSGNIKEQLAYLPNDVEFVSGKVEAVETALDNDSRAIKNLRDVVRADIEDARITFRVCEQVKTPEQYRYTGLTWNTINPRGPNQGSVPGQDGATDEESTDLVQYFLNKAKQYDGSLDMQTRLLGEIEQHLRTVEANTLQQTHELLMRRNAAAAGGEEHSGGKVRELAALFGEIQRAILTQAKKVGECREKVVETTLGNAGAGGLGF